MTNMTSKNISYIVLGLFVIVGWNVLIIQRDKKMFEGYDRMNAKERTCAELKTFHPDCKVE